MGLIFEAYNQIAFQALQNIKDGLNSTSIFTSGAPLLTSGAPLLFYIWSTPPFFYRPTDNSPLISPITTTDMPRLRKLLLHNHAIFITTSLESGLMLPPNPLINTLLESALARAQYHHPVRICHFLIESNHMHIIAQIDNPDDITGFMERFKTESAHAVNKLLGRRKRTIWCKGYDSPLLLTLEDCIDKIVYLYTNPAKDNLVSSIKRFPGLSSWKAKRERRCPWIRRDALFPLKNHSLTLKQYTGIARKLKEAALSSHTLTLSPDAWMEAFGIEEQQEIDSINEEIKQRVKETELAYEAQRKESGRGVIGALKLMLQPMNTPYTPKRAGRKMWCICRDIELRKKFIQTARELAQEAAEVYQSWKRGELLTPFPPGLFPPRIPKLVEPLTIY